MKLAMLLCASVMPVWCLAEPEVEAIALNCMSCHRAASENTAGQIPSLADFSERQLRQSLLDFKYDNTQATLMPRIAKGYSDQTLSALARYLARH